MKVTIEELKAPDVRAFMAAGGSVTVVDSDGRTQFVMSHGRDKLECCYESVRYREALEKIVEQAPRCEDCEVETPEGVAPIATHIRRYGGGQPLCADHADIRNQDGEHMNPGCQNDWVALQPAHVTIAIEALERKPPT